MIIESISIKPKAISTFMTLEELIGGQGQRSRPFYGSGQIEKASNMTRDLFSNYDYSQTTESESVKKHIGEKCLLHLCTTIFRKVMAAIFQDGGHFQHGNLFLDSFLQTCEILMILVSNQIFLTLHNLNFDFRNSVKLILLNLKQRVKIHHVD